MAVHGLATTQTPPKLHLPNLNEDVRQNNAIVTLFQQKIPEVSDQIAALKTLVDSSPQRVLLELAVEKVICRAIKKDASLLGNLFTDNEVHPALKAFALKTLLFNENCNSACLRKTPALIQKYDIPQEIALKAIEQNFQDGLFLRAMLSEFTSEDMKSSKAGYVRQVVPKGLWLEVYWEKLEWDKGSVLSETAKKDLTPVWWY